MLADRILRGMHKVLAHDLPNQVVVLQSLLQLLDQEDSARLSEDGRELLRRMQSAARRAGDMARFLKEMERIRTFVVRSERIELSLLARELQGELQRRHPGRHFAFAWQWQAPAIVGDPRVFLHAVPELCTGLLQHEGDACQLTAGSRETAAGVELTIQLDEPASTSPRCSIEALEQRMEIILARAWLGLCSTNVALSLPGGGGARVCLSMAKR